MEHLKKHKGAGRKFIDQGRHRHGARDIAAAVDSADVLPQAEEAVAQVDE